MRRAKTWMFKREAGKRQYSSYSFTGIHHIEFDLKLAVGLLRSEFVGFTLIMPDLQERNCTKELFSDFS